MTRRDLAWRVSGGAIGACGFLLSHADLDNADLNTLSGACGFILAIVGLVLLIQGKRIPLALRIERSRHRELPLAIALRRSRSRSDR